MQEQNLIYLYDLPKDKVSSTKIAEIFKEQAGVKLDPKPQLKMDPTRPFYSAMVIIKDNPQWQLAAEKMRYFEIDGKPCRALPFDRSLLGSNKEKLFDQSVFVKLPKDILHRDLERIFSEYGQIKSLKVSLNPDYTSRGYGFICFQDKDSAQQALNSSKAEIQVKPLLPKTTRQMRKLINNVYVKNIPKDWTVEMVRDLFKPFGNIKSLVLQENEFGQFGFVCYDDVEGVNKEYGPDCAEKSIQELNDRDMGNGLKLVVKHALKKNDREQEKLRETIRYKASKRRCNLYVKNFPNHWKDQDLANLFKPYGEIEKIRVDSSPNGNAFAFVCFKEPNDAAQAKQNLHNHNLEGKMLLINYYEIKEIRKIQMEGARDKADWDKYQAQQTGGFKWNDIANQPHFAQMLQSLLAVIQYNEQANNQMNQAERQMKQGNRGGRGQGGSNRGHPQGGYQQPGFSGQQPSQVRPNQMGGIPQPQRHMPPMMPGMPPVNHQLMNMPQPGIPQPIMMGPQPGMPMNIAQEYEMKAQRILPAVQERNPNLKDQVGGIIFDYIEKMVGQERAPKITGMLIELPVPQIQMYMSSYGNLQMKVQEANEHLMRALGN